MLNLSQKNFHEEYLTRKPTFINDIFWKLRFLKYVIQSHCIEVALFPKNVPNFCGSAHNLFLFIFLNSINHLFRSNKMTIAQNFIKWQNSQKEVWWWHYLVKKTLISNRCISGLMSNLIKKSWKVSNYDLSIRKVRNKQSNVKELCFPKKASHGSFVINHWCCSDLVFF